MTDTQVPHSAADGPDPVHIADCKAISSGRPVISPLCGEAGETAPTFEDATCRTCLEILAAVRPRPRDVLDFEHPDGVDIRIADEQDAEHAALRSRISVPTTACLWVPEDAITFTPPLADVVYGDGRRVFAFTTTHDRPAFWAVRGDSSWRTELRDGGDTDIVEYVDVITENLLLEFGDGEPRYEHEDDTETELPYPAINLSDGYSWSILKVRESKPDERPPTAAPPEQAARAAT